MEKLVVWEELSFIAGLCQVPICYMGDFNEVTQVEERKGPDRLTGSAEDFKCWIQDMQLVDLPLWHKEKFGDMDKKIQRFEEKIRKIDKLVGSGVYNGTMEARRKALMSRSKHAKDMDKNTRYFHNLASARRRNNRLDVLERSPVVGFRDGLVNQINEEDSIVLERMPTMEEIREAVRDCESSKAPRSDGYNMMNFIKKCWDEIGREFMAVVLDFFR
nr:uncharacterized protein LOC112773777 [Arachis hypogaea]